MKVRAADGARAFVLANTQVLAPPHVPQLRLHLASEAHDLWLSTERELAAIDLPPPFWAFAWAGGQGLARHVLDHPQWVSGRRVLDFASGSGLVAIAAAMAGAAHVTALDIDPFSGAAIALNAALNGVEVEARIEDPVGRPVEADIVLAGDVFYDRAFAARLMPWFDELAASGRDVLVGDPGRAYLPRERLVAIDEQCVPTSRALEDEEVKRVRICRWRAP